MSLTVEIYLHRDSLPDADAWSRRLSACGFPLRFTEPVDLNLHSGYLPAKWKNRSAGFEYSLGAIDRQNVPPSALALLGDRDSVIEFRYTELIEARSAIAAAAVMAAMTDGIYHDPQSGKLATSADAVSTISEDCAELERELAKSAGMTRGQWQKNFLRICQEVSPEYAINRDLSGRVTEMLRPHETGLLVSQNCISVHDRYYHCFALLFSKINVPQLHYPLLAGDRFDHNRTVDTVLRDHLGERLRTGSFHGGRLGWEEFSRESVAKAEAKLMPLFLAELSAGWRNLYDLFTHALDLVQRLDLHHVASDTSAMSKDALEYAAKQLGAPPHEWSKDTRRHVMVHMRAHELGYDLESHWAFSQHAANLSAMDVANPESRFAKLYSEIPVSMRPTCAFLSHFETFLAVHAQLPDMIATCERLRDYRGPRPRGGLAGFLSRLCR